MDFIDEVSPTSLDGQNENLSIEIYQNLIDNSSIYFEDEESDDYYLFQFGVGGPA